MIGLIPKSEILFHQAQLALLAYGTYESVIEMPGDTVIFTRALVAGGMSESQAAKPCNPDQK